ncbi:hypothetical protein chiPu_0016012 [Chiloscyllium punctatum]|uniref:Uncharacterized protein n=1 Tax=Chiloscyllium punctatum TaxID=137246 RepID=A0A401T4E3_CHIPU|nr:hypothetical protein [Chiloscyllium punctatum]
MHPALRESDPCLALTCNTKSSSGCGGEGESRAVRSRRSCGRRGREELPLAPVRSGPAAGCPGNLCLRDEVARGGKQWEGVEPPCPERAAWNSEEHHSPPQPTQPGSHEGTGSDSREGACSAKVGSGRFKD